MNILDKAYKGPIYLISFVISIGLLVLNSDQVADLDLVWVPIVVQILTMAAWLVQQFTPIGDGSPE